MPSPRLVTFDRVGLFDAAGSSLLPAGKPLAVLVYLALAPDPVPRSSLVRLLWPNVDRAVGLHSLRQALVRLRAVLGQHALESVDGDRVRLAPGAVTVDLFELEAAAREDRADDVLALWAGPFLDAFGFAHHGAWEEWVEEIRSRTSEMVARTLYARAESIKDDDRCTATALLHRALKANPLLGEAWALRFDLEADSGQLEAAAETLAAARETLAGLPGFDLAGRQHRLEGALGRRLSAAGRNCGQLELTGRTRETAMLMRAWRATRAGAARLAVVSGAAGMGRTRLVAELAAHARDEGATVVEFRARTAERDLSGALASEMSAGMLAQRGAAGISAESLAALESLVPRAARAPRPVAAERLTATYADALVDVIGAVADDSPLLLVLEDLHWADEVSTALICRALRQLRDVPCLAVLTYRLDATNAEALPALNAFLLDVDSLHLRLSPLGSDDVSEALAPLFDGDDAAGSPALRMRVANRLHDVTGGIPFCLAETLRSLEREGVLRVEGGRARFDLRRLPDVITPPASVESALSDRLAALEGDAAKLVARLAACQEAATSADLRLQFGGSDAQFKRTIEDLVARGIVRWSGEGQLAFVTDHLRDVANSMFVAKSQLEQQHRPRRTARILPLLGGVAIAVGASAYVMSVASRTPRFGGGRIEFISGDSAVSLDPGDFARSRRERLRYSSRITYGPFRTASGDLRRFARIDGVTETPFIVEILPSGPQALIRAPGADVDFGGLSPDGRFISYTRQDVRRSGYALDLLVAHSDGSGARVIYRGADKVVAGGWSADGGALLATIVAPTDTVVVLNPNGDRVATFAFGDEARPSWCGTGRAFVTAAREGERFRIFLADAMNRQMTEVPAKAVVGSQVVCSPDGSGLIYEAAEDGLRYFMLQDLRTGREQRLPVQPSGLTTVRWVPDTIAPMPHSVRVLRPRTVLRVGEQSPLAASIRFSDGSTRLGPVAWKSQDPSVAFVSTHGLVTANRPGRTFVSATVDGWITDSAEITVGRETLGRTAFEDHFESLDSIQWISVGEPTPAIERFRGESVLSMRGDGIYTDGVVTRAAFPLPRGATLEVGFRVELSRRDQQSIVVCLLRSDPPTKGAENFALWKTREQACFRYPGHELVKFRPNEGLLYNINIEHPVRLSGVLPTNGWVQLALEMRPDGTITAYVNSRLVSTLPLRVGSQPDARWRIGLFGAAVGTDVMVRDLYLWPGLRFRGG